MELLNLEIPIEILDSFEIPGDHGTGASNIETYLIYLRYDFPTQFHLQETEISNFGCNKLRQRGTYH